METLGAAHKPKAACTVDMTQLHHVAFIPRLVTCVGQLQLHLWNSLGGAVDPVGFEEVRLDRSRVAIAQLVARRFHNPKVVGSILTCHTLVESYHAFQRNAQP